jgi:hypothetical protein
MKQNNSYVPELRRVQMPAMPIDATIQHTIDVPATATQHIEVKTSAVDRAQGFLLASIPLYLAFATAVVALCVLGLWPTVAIAADADGVPPGIRGGLVPGLHLHIAGVGRRRQSLRGDLEMANYRGRAAS